MQGFEGCGGNRTDVCILQTEDWSGTTDKEMSESVSTNSGFSAENRSAHSKNLYEDIYVNEDASETRMTRRHMRTMISGTHTQANTHLKVDFKLIHDFSAHFHT